MLTERFVCPAYLMLVRASTIAIASTYRALSERRVAPPNTFRPAMWPQAARGASAFWRRPA